MIVDSHNGKKVPILVMKDRWLLFCLPLLLLNAIVYLFYQIVLRPYFFVLTAIAERILRTLSARLLVNIPVLLGIHCVAHAGLCWNSYVSETLQWSGWYLITITVITTMMCLIAISYTAQNRFGVRTDLVLRFSALDNPPEHLVSVPLPKGLLVTELSRGIFLGSLMAAMLVLFSIGIMIAAEPFSAAFWLSIHSLVLATFLVNLEVIEHLSAHSVRGRITKLDDPSPLARFFYVLESVRREVVWPLFFCLPDAYYYQHTHHHHVENNGPADWQSTIRFNQSSVLDFAKSLNMFEFSTVFPIDTLRYFKAMNRNRMRRMLMLSCVRGYAVILAVLIIEPYVALAPIMLQFGRGWVIHQFLFAWHGFHDATKLYDVEASNNFDEHYAHHKKPGVHIFSPEIMDVYRAHAQDPDKTLPIYKQDIGYFMVSEHWLLIQSLMWQRKFAVIRNLIDCDHLTDAELYRLVSGHQLVNRRPFLQRLDRRLSSTAGRIVERVALLRLPAHHKYVLSSGDPQSNYDSGGGTLA